MPTKCRYGMRAMIELARAHGKKPLTRRDIARSQKVSGSYLENIMIQLKRAGFVRALRGARGGFELAMPPSSVTMLDIVKALDSRFAPLACLEKPAACRRSSNCTARVAWQKLHEAQCKMLASMTLDGLAKLEA